MIAYTSDAILYQKTMQCTRLQTADDHCQTIPAIPDPSMIKAVGKISKGILNRLVVERRSRVGSLTALIADMYKKKTGAIDMDDTTGRAMQAFFVLCDAIDRAGSTEPAKIQAALKATDLKPNQLMMGYKRRQVR